MVPVGTAGGRGLSLDDCLSWEGALPGQGADVGESKGLLPVFHHAVHGFSATKMPLVCLAEA